MPRKATKNTSASASRSSSKRPAPEAPARQSKRARATARKSYVEPGSETDEADGDMKEEAPSSENESEAAASDYEEQSDKNPSSSEPEQDEADSDDDDHAKVKRATPKGRPAKSLPMHSKHVDEKELWSQGAKLAPGTRVIIKKPKARDAGDTPYLDGTIHPNTMLFLKDLKANNDRQWLKLHDPDFRAAFRDFETFTEKVSEKVIEADETIPELPVKDIIYRIYRDIRFSKDPTPYKTYFSAAWSRTGRKGPYAHYYMQVQPGGGSFLGMCSFPTFLHTLDMMLLCCCRATRLRTNSLGFRMQTRSGTACDASTERFALSRGSATASRYRRYQRRVRQTRCGGFWQPDAASLAKLRRDVDRKPHKIKAVLTDAGIRKSFLGGVQNDEKKAVKAFTNLTSNQSNALKRNPKGYNHDHKDIELLRLRNFTIGRKLQDSEIIGQSGLDRVAELVLDMVPFVSP
ncbi:hypothetical protein BDW02DRAFT_495181 [Decorospora gaudefroyi]|uniref:Uncharacterized protein n=1 Tax=Decorospora gaudefroyi TaxID=184978 RepID=A0A6A5KJZ9_9PLEO|nr:hypothetical protein BDW02DRAFT_495181 [Decorospora gaudefroyi]